MENEIQNNEIQKLGAEEIKEPIFKPRKKRDYLLPASILLAAGLVGGSWIYSAWLQFSGGSQLSQAKISELEEKVIPTKGFTLSVNWGDLGVQLTDSGVIDKERFLALYAKQGGLQESDKKLLEQTNNGKIVMTPYNANFLLNLFWALGLGNKNDILEKGPMSDPQYSGVEKFASTGGWSLSKGNPMNHYSKHSMIILTPEQQVLVERVSKGIYRPCCGNSTYFPDCNHGMAMLGLLELMASQGISEKDMYKAALQVNAYWFPDTYLTIAQYFQNKGIKWDNVDPKEVLGVNFSSSSGYQKVLAEVEPVQGKKGGSCGV